MAVSESGIKNAQQTAGEMPFGEMFMTMQMMQMFGLRGGVFGKVSQLMGTALAANTASKALTGNTLKDQFSGLKNKIADFADPEQGGQKFENFYENSWLKKILDGLGVKEHGGMKDMLRNVLESIGSRIEKDEAAVEQEFNNTALNAGQEQVKEENKVVEQVKQATSGLNVKVNPDGSMEISGDPDAVNGFVGKHQPSKEEVAIGEQVSDTVGTPDAKSPKNPVEKPVKKQAKTR